MQYATLGDVLNLLRGLLPHDAELCVGCLEVLLQIDSLTRLPLSEKDDNGVDITKSLSVLQDLCGGLRQKGLPPPEDEEEGEKKKGNALPRPGAKAEEAEEAEVPALSVLGLPPQLDKPTPPPAAEPPAAGEPLVAAVVAPPAALPAGAEEAAAVATGSESSELVSQPQATAAGDESNNIAASRLSFSMMTASFGLTKFGTESRASGTEWRRMWLPPLTDGGLLARIFVILDDPERSSVGMVTAIVLLVTIGISTVAFVMESMPEFRSTPAACFVERTALNCEPVPDGWFFHVEAVCIAIFTVDYVVRIATVHAHPSSAPNRLLATWRYFILKLNMVDLIAILPFYVNLLVGNVGHVRVLRLARILRLFKAAKHQTGMIMLGKVMVMSGLPLMILLFFNTIITLLFAALIYFAEGMRYSVAPQFTAASDACGGEACFPYGVYVRKTASLDADEVSPFRSIPSSCWFVATTMTTVGYGDISPTTVMGKVIGVVIFYAGIIFLALPISVIVSNFEIVYERHIGPRKGAARKLRRRKSIIVGATPWLPHGDSFREKLFLLLEDPTASVLGEYLSMFIIFIIVASTTSFVLETLPSFRQVDLTRCDPSALTIEDCQPQPHAIFYRLEVVCIIIFTVDYLLRITFVHSVRPTQCGLVDPDAQKVPQYSPFRLTVLYVLQILNVVDFLAVVPFYVELASGGGGGASVLRVLRLVRIFRVLKMPKLRSLVDMFTHVVADALPALMTVLFMTALMSILFCSLIVFAESSSFSVDHFQEDYPTGAYIRPTKDGYDVEVSPFRSILYAFWWFFTTATTVGYGDDFPTTTAGRLVCVAAFYTGIVLIALPITIVGGCFNTYYPRWVQQFMEGEAGSYEKGTCKRIVAAEEAEAIASESSSLSPPQQIEWRSLDPRAPKSGSQQRELLASSSAAGAQQENSSLTPVKSVIDL
eukprot:TRINITY_DN25151_c0_g1_i2.p1 TRINITY_DN25151_c0_g1~~TRINITY_DN25151_c0_g1_i2.p1  ORF type:complete len:940 (+),score=147.70 TRINITY_DN25151_c0_g1_i2:115-2934(+)